MSEQRLLVLDSSYLCHRAFHVAGHLSYHGIATGVVYGFLQSIATLKEDFATDRICFCFEGEGLRRKDLYPSYKGTRRHSATPEEKKAYESLRHQIHTLRTDYLPTIGFRNIFHAPGFESDDLMAAIAASHGGRVVLVTSDSDLYQCLTDTVSVYSPHKQKLYTKRWFCREYGIRPTSWAVVKAIAGCSGDNVEGIRGVGEATALKFVRGELPEQSKAYQAIKSAEGKATVRRNRRLVQLPFEGCPVPTLQPDNITTEGWREVCGRLGLRSLANKLPLRT